MQTRPLTFAIIVLGAAAVSAVHVVKPAWPHMIQLTSFGFRFVGALLLFSLQVELLRRIHFTGSFYRAALAFCIFCAFLLVEYPIYILLNGGQFGTAEEHLSGLPSIGFFNFILSWPSTLLFGCLLLGVWLRNSQNPTARYFARALVLLMAALFSHWMLSPFQRVLIIEAMEDVKLYALADQKMEKPIAVLAAGTKANVSYCADLKSYIVPVILVPDQPGTLALVGHEKRKFEIKRTGPLGRPRVFGCGDR